LQGNVANKIDFCQEGGISVATHLLEHGTSR
jgi:hypothetical protein